MARGKADFVIISFNYGKQRLLRDGAKLQLPKPRVVPATTDPFRQQYPEQRWPEEPSLLGTDYHPSVPHAL